MAKPSLGPARNFDLNIEKILEGWEISHGIRELIANALDEEVLTGTPDIELTQGMDGAWHIRDFGRGLSYEHLTQNENQEKLCNPNQVIGKFGVGLKDALATLKRRGVAVLISSRHNCIALTEAPKIGFEDVVTLQATVRGPRDPTMVGTDIRLTPVSANDIALAKSYFLRFSNEEILETTALGQILQRIENEQARIYVNGLLVAREWNFLFSYNITSLNAAMHRALNREHTNVGRTAYMERVKAILLSSTSKIISTTLAIDLQQLTHGNSHDEVSWNDIAVHACKISNEENAHVFVTATQIEASPNLVMEITEAGKDLIVISETVAKIIKGSVDLSNKPMMSLSNFVAGINQNTLCDALAPDSLTPEETAVFSRCAEICRLVGGLPQGITIEVSETLQKDVVFFVSRDGFWHADRRVIAIKRSVLANLSYFAGILLHELAHARSGLPDVNRGFES